MVRWGMVIDLDRCTACQACSFACSAENNCDFTTPAEAGMGRLMGWHQVLSQVKGTYPRPQQQFVPRPCMHCEEPPCVKVCPVGATYRRDDGIVMQDVARCIGCRTCMVGCPYNVRVFHWRDYGRALPEPMDRATNPDSPPRRPKGVVAKCQFCFHRLDRLRRELENGEAPKFFYSRLRGYRGRGPISDRQWGEGVDLLMRYFYAGVASLETFDARTVGYLPACIQVCAARASAFGDLENPASLVSELARNPRAFVLLEGLNTLPSVTYLASDRTPALEVIRA